MTRSNLLPMSSLSISVLIAAFCSGCCSGMVWQETGKVTTHVEETRADFSRPGELTMNMTGWQETAYLPWWPMGHDSWEKSVTLPLNRLPDREIGFPRDCEIHVGTYMKKFRFHKTESGLWSMAKHQHGYVHPDDIRYLSEPYIENELAKELMIPLEVRESEDESGKRVVHVRRYWATTVHFPGYRFERDMEGFGITVWRCCLLPVPIVCDIATFPVQAFVLFSYMIWGRKGVSGWWE